MSEYDQILDRITAGPRGKRGPHCPPASQLAELAAGLAGEKQRASLLDHVCVCDSCGAVLRAMEADFAPEVLDAEAEEVAALRTSSRQWQREFASKMAGRRRPKIVLTWIARAAAVAVCTTSAWLGWSQWVLYRPAQLMAQAYTQERPFEFRIPMAGYAPVRTAKGLGSSFQRPAGLIEAEAQIHSRTQDHPNARWLALRARAEMLGRNPEAAIETYTRALEQRPDDPDLLAGLGMACALNAEASNRPVDYGKAIEYLTRSLQAKPDAAETIFNRAIVYERMFLVKEAIDEWTRYLSLDPNGEWAQEARNRLAALEEKKKSIARP
ncbi:MAG: hypothetical protein HY820_27545 [Acidobacteria bacterium]|nr:hypothetical protein [Acidobacteriota bacterium]